VAVHTVQIAKRMPPNEEIDDGNRCLGSLRAI
jgi:hypothetical protein